MTLRPFCCAFVLSILSSSLTFADTPAPAEGTGIEGVISISPTVGGPIRPDMPSTAPLRDMEFLVRSGELKVATFKTNGEGKFRIWLPPGHYIILRADWSGRIGYYGPFEVDVAAGRMSKVHWTCDTGMR